MPRRGQRRAARIPQEEQVEVDPAPEPENPIPPLEALRELFEMHGFQRNRPVRQFNKTYTGEEDPEAFLEALDSYCEQAGVPDEDAVSLMPQVLEGQAFVWWRATGKHLETWEEVKEALRETFGTQRMDYMVLDEMLNSRQKAEQSVSSFLSTLAVENAKRTDPLPDTVVAELAYLRIRPELRARIVMDNGFTLGELKGKAAKVEALIAHEARTRTKQLPPNGSAQKTGSTRPGNDYSRRWEPKRREDTARGTATRETRTFREPLKCEDCGALGWTVMSCRRHGPCSGTRGRPPGRIAGVGRIDDKPWDRPCCEVDVEGRKFPALIDTGADLCVGGKAVYQWCLERNKGLRETTSPRMADGRETRLTTYMTDLEIRCQEKSAAVKMLVQPHRQDGDIILGCQFLHLTGMVIDMGRGTWRFSDQGEGEGSPPKKEPRIAEVALELPQEKRERVQRLLKRYRVCFEGTGRPVEEFEFAINTGNAPPIQVKPYRVSPARREAMREAVRGMMEEGVIEESSSPWSAPLIMIPKVGGTWRPCVDFRRLNAVTEDEVFPLPRLEDLLMLREETPYISSLDVRNGYWCLRIRDSDRQKTAFSTPFGHFQFKRMPFGVKNGAAAFQRLMNKVLEGLIDKTCVVYMDDILVVSKTFNEHLQHLAEIFERLSRAGLSLNASKCHFLREEVKFLGHVVTTRGVKVDPDKVAAVTKMPDPLNKEELQTILGMIGWYRRFIPDFADRGKPLFKLLKKDQRWEWTESQQEGLRYLRERLTTAPC